LTTLTLFYSHDKCQNKKLGFIKKLFVFLAVSKSFGAFFDIDFILRFWTFMCLSIGYYHEYETMRFLGIYLLLFIYFYFIL